MYSQCMPRAHLNDLWTNTCGLVSRCSTCFWDCRSMHVQWSVKNVRRAKRTYYIGKSFEDVSVVSHRTTRGYGTCSFSRWPTTHFIRYARHCWSLSYSSFSTGTSRHCGCIYALCLLFHFCARLLALSFSLPSPFCRRNNETASAATALRTINLRKCTQNFVNRIF